MKSAQMCWIVTIQTACNRSHIASPPQTHTQGGIFHYTGIQIQQFCLVRAHISGPWQTADPGVNEQLHSGCGSRRDTSGRPTDQPTTQQPPWHELPHTPGGLLTRQSAYELWTHMQHMPAWAAILLQKHIRILYSRKKFGHISLNLWFSWVFYIKAWN